ncbi:MAG TPA: hypothetical protein VMH80_08535 [Bryobacteraceae bacterium]|nr:hypothetical protein [Bryobacteraceae bacterium]
MKKPASAGLIAAGNLTDSPLTRFHRLSEFLGPVKSPSYRLASRITNILRAGRPVKDYADLELCSLILIAVPANHIAHLVLELLASGIAWRGKCVVLLSDWQGSGDLHPLAARGASVGSISPIPGFDNLYLVEGDRRAILDSRRLLESRITRTVAIERSLKPLYLAALTCTGSLLFALLLAASESLRLAGITPVLRASILERQLDRTLRAFLKGGRRAYQSPQEFPRQLRALAAKDEALGNYLEQTSRLASRLMEER